MCFGVCHVSLITSSMIHNRLMCFVYQTRTANKKMKKKLPKTKNKPILDYRSTPHKRQNSFAKGETP